MWSLNPQCVTFTSRGHLVVPPASQGTCKREWVRKTPKTRCRARPVFAPMSSTRVCGFSASVPVPGTSPRSLLFSSQKHSWTPRDVEGFIWPTCRFRTVYTSARKAAARRSWSSSSFCCCHALLRGPARPVGPAQIPLRPSKVWRWRSGPPASGPTRRARSAEVLLGQTGFVLGWARLEHSGAQHSRAEPQDLRSSCEPAGQLTRVPALTVHQGTEHNARPEGNFFFNATCACLSRVQGVSKFGSQVSCNLLRHPDRLSK